MKQKMKANSLILACLNLPLKKFETLNFNYFKTLHKIHTDKAKHIKDAHHLLLLLWVGLVLKSTNNLSVKCYKLHVKCIKTLNVYYIRPHTELDIKINCD